MRFQRVAVIDWSAAARPKRGRDSVWLGLASDAGVSAENPPTRAGAEARLHALVADTLAAGERLLIGADFAFGFPTGFAGAVTGAARALAVWDWLAARVTDTAGNRSNYRQVAATLNRLFPGDGPFWGNGERLDTPDLPRLKPALPPGLAEHRATDIAGREGGARPKPVWQLAGAGAVGAQVLTGLPVLQRLRAAFGGKVSVWPFEGAEAPVVLAEVYPSLLSAEVRAMCAAHPGLTPDEAQVRLLATAFATLSARGQLGDLFRAATAAEVLAEEGWILGAGHGMALRAALPATQDPPRLRDDCFAMPQGVQWVPVDEALARLRGALVPVTGVDELPVSRALGRVLARDAVARRSNPPQANSAVDGYGFAHAATGSGPQRLPLVNGRAAAGQPFDGVVPPGAAIRILTGAILPEGVDCVVLEEDCATDGAAVVFDGPVKPRANTRRAGEDVVAGAVALTAGHRLRAPDLALLSALGIDRVTACRPLRVGVLSTGDEIVSQPGAPVLPHQIYDANRPMLLGLAAGWGYEPVDLGHVRDDPRRIAAALDRGATRADVILTSGGASAGDEDHVSHLLRTQGTLSSWRIAMKPGRPLALALWRGVPVIGLPGNPVAALVCALIFGRPALSLLAGGSWQEARGFSVPAAFSKTKKAGRREYLRARLDEAGRAEVFASEGSGRISGLSWAEGLVELPDAAMDIRPGTLVRFLPYDSFGVI
ncbi:MAG: molybdopterin molybdenumtransferase MoeA [Rhodobacteraceae bacterium]|nr:molybdopterin molybdenumtransferase MoeA [Paracoccaceae bacterium]